MIKVTCGKSDAAFHPGHGTISALLKLLSTALAAPFTTS